MLVVLQKVKQTRLRCRQPFHPCTTQREIEKNTYSLTYSIIRSFQEIAIQQIRCLEIGTIGGGYSRYHGLCSKGQERSKL